jgi:tripartite-type tricarboxylate transporter receptor subunit TctC
MAVIFKDGWKPPEGAAQQAMPYKATAIFSRIAPDIRFALIVEVVNIPIVCTVRADTPWRTMLELLEYTRWHSATIRVGSFGPDHPTPRASTPHQQSRD